MKRLLRTVALVLVMTMTTLPAVADVTDEDVARARAEVNALLSDSQALGAEVQEAWAHQFELEDEISSLQTSIEIAHAKIGETEQRLEDVAVELYMGSTTSANLQILFSASSEGFEASRQYLDQVTGSDRDIVNQLKSLRTELGNQTDRLADASEEQVALTADLEQKAGALQQRLVDAQAVYDGLVQRQAQEEAARQAAAEAARRAAAEEAARNATTTTVGGTPNTTVGGGDAATTTNPPSTGTTAPPAPPPVPSSGNGTCPVAGAVSFTDSFGAPRSGGRRHEGVDMIAARGTPVVALYNGRIHRITTGALSGLAIWLKSDSGDQFFYAHLDSYADISTGQSVSAGQVIGYVGSTGNAPEWLPHLHFEYHPGGGGAVDPYPLVKTLCG